LRPWLVFTVDDLEGTDVRNLRDEYLGSISDLAFDARSGEITYVIVARGGFLGIGEEHVAVPWGAFRATPGFNSLILDVSENRLEQAPMVDPDTFADDSAVSTQDEEVNRYWDQQS
jgi:sporulation protein YlmC with PRC-barrel domain